LILPVHAFIPCRKGSQRVINKNTRPLPGFPGGLLELKLRQIAASKELASVILSTDDPCCVEVARGCEASLGKPIAIVDRPPEYAIADSLDAFVLHVADIMPPGDVAWLHVTSPFFDAAEIDRAIVAYRQAVERGEADSLMGVTKVQTFIWADGRCISHDRSIAKWPQTQDLKPFYAVNSTIFLIDRDTMAATGDRITDRVHLHEVDPHPAFDVDWPSDFEFVENVLQTRAAPEAPR
jgi:CMP-N-acetylneuraminic acid synthetase